MPVLTFGRAQGDDIPAVVRLVEAAYRGAPSRAGWTSEADLLHGQRVDATMLAETLARPGAIVLLARRDGELVSCCELQRPAAGDPAYLGMFAVDPTLQSGGIGRLVLDEAERIVSDEWHVDRLELTVIDLRTPLIEWYERRGYERTGRFSAFPYGDERFGVPTRDDLRFETLVKHLRPAGTSPGGSDDRT